MKSIGFIVFFISLFILRISHSLALNTILNPLDYIEIPLFYLNASYFNIGGLFALTSTFTKFTTASGIQRLEAFRYSINQINSNPNLLPSVNLTYDVYDTQSLAMEALPATINLINTNNVTCIVGPPTTDESFVVGAFTTLYNVSVISYATTGSHGLEGNVENFLEVSPNDQILIQGIITTMLRFQWTLIVPLFTNDTYGVAGRNAFLTLTQGTGMMFDCFISVPFIESFNINSGISSIYNTISNCIANSKATVVLIYMNDSNALSLLNVLYQNPANSDLTFFGSATALNFLDDTSASFFTNFPFSYLQGSIGLIPHIGNVSGFTDYFRSLTPENNANIVFNSYWEETFRCNLTSDPSIPYCPSDLNDRSLTLKCRCDDTESLTDVPIDSRVGYVQDSVYVIAKALDRILYNCTSITFDDYCNLSAVSGTQIYNVITNFPIVGSTGLIEFNGIYRKDAYCDILQINQGLGVVIGNYFPNNTLYINSTLLKFKGDTIPVSAVIPQVILFNSGIGAIVLAFAIIAIFMSVVCSIAFFVFKDEKVVKASSPLFCQLILLGIILIAVGMIIFGVKNQNTMTCILKIWLSVIGFGLILGNILAKTYRIFKIFTNKRATINAITDKELLYYSFGILFIEITLLSITTFSTGLPRALLLYSTTTPFYAYIGCHLPNYTFQVTMTFIIIAINSILFILVAFLAYLTRNVDSDFNESASIALLCYVYTGVLIMGTTVYFTNGDGQDSASKQFVERSAVTIIILFATIVALFGPKMKRLLPAMTSYRFFKLTTSENPRYLEYNESSSDSSSNSSMEAISTMIRPRFITSRLWPEKPRRKIIMTPSDTTMLDLQ